MKGKRIFGFLVLLTMVFLVACGGDDSANSSDTSVVGGDLENATEITYWTFVDNHKDFFEDAAKRWNEEYPDRPIKLVSEVYPADQMMNNLTLSLQSGEGAPVLADIEVNRFPSFLKGEPQLEPMNEYVEPVLDKFVESRFDIYAKDGKYYGLPTHVGATVMYYNKKIMDEAGVDIDSIKTWDDYVEAGKQVVENTDAMMTTVETGTFNALEAMTLQQDQDFLTDDGEVNLDNDATLRSLELLYDMVNEYEIAELTPGGKPGAEEFFGYMNDGGAASLLMPFWYMTRFVDNMPDLKGEMVIRPLPAWEEGGKRSAGMGGTGTVITNQTEETDIAKEFLAYAKLSEEGNIQLWKKLGFDPPMWDVWDNKALQERDNQFFKYFGDDIFTILLSIRDEINSPNKGELTPDITEQLSANVLNNVFRQESQTPEEALQEAHNNIANE